MRIRTLSSHSKYSDPSWVGNFVRRPEERCCGDGSYFSLTLWWQLWRPEDCAVFKQGLYFSISWRFLTSVISFEKIVDYLKVEKTKKKEKPLLKHCEDSNFTPPHFAILCCKSWAGKRILGQLPWGFNLISRNFALKNKQTAGWKKWDISCLSLVRI